MHDNIYFGIHHEICDNMANETAKDAKRDASAAKNEAAHLKAEIERLYMITESLWLLMKKMHNLDDQVLIDVVKQVDLQDGVLDGRSKKATTQAKCPKCQRVVSRRRPVCVYCGAEVEVHPFEK